MKIQWPAVINYEDDVELVLLNSNSDWDLEAKLHRFNGGAEDRLIDSRGNIFYLVNDNQHGASLRNSDESISLVDFLGLIKAHAAEKDSCCIANLYAPSFPDAFKILASLADD